MSSARLDRILDAHEEQPRSSAPPPWIITFADLMVLLMCFFVLMLSFSEMDPEKFKLMSGELKEAFGSQTVVVADGLEPGTGANAMPTELPVAMAVFEAAQADAAAVVDADDERRLAELKASEDRAAAQAAELRDEFRAEIAAGQLLVRLDGTDVVIQLLEKDSFASGSAALEPSFVPTLAKIGAVVARANGAITISGHTDNVPVRSGGLYRSNWELSAARAASVAHELLQSGIDPARVMVSGHADTQPRAPNDTPANRALNRRVDITFLNGKERHGAWADAAPVRTDLLEPN